MAPEYPQILLQNRHPDRTATVEEYRQSGGYQALTTVLEKYSFKDLQDMILDSKLLGRGGAAFPTGMKLTSVDANAPFPRYIVCNADEMEPGTFKDRVLIHADPHMIIEGMILAGFGISAEKGIIFIRPEYESGAKIFERELKVAREAGYLGTNILGSNYSLDIIVHRSAGRYICGEVTAQLNALMGKRPNPVQPPPYPTEKGLWSLPTVLSNVETFACMPHIVRNGAEWFKSLASTESGAGTKLFGISGKVNRPGCYELPIGIRLSEIIEEHAGGMLPLGIAMSETGAASFLAENVLVVTGNLGPWGVIFGLYLVTALATTIEMGCRTPQAMATRAPMAPLAVDSNSACFCTRVGALPHLSKGAMAVAANKVNPVGIKTLL